MSRDTHVSTAHFAIHQLNVAILHVTTRGVSLLMETKKNTFSKKEKNFACRYSGASGIWCIATWAVVQHHNVLLSFFLVHVKLKRSPNFFLALNTVIGFVRHKSNLIFVSNCMRSHNGSNGTPLEPLFFGWTISSSYKHWSPLVLCIMCPF